MNTDDYKLKRKNLLDTTPTYIKLVDAGLILAIVAAMFLVVVYMQARDAAEQVMAQKAQTHLAEQETKSCGRTFAECMNGGTLFDKINETAYFCSKPLEIKKP